MALMMSRKKNPIAEMNYIRVDMDSPTAFDATKVYFSLSRDTSVPTLSINSVNITAKETYSSSGIYRYLFEVDDLHSTDTIVTNGRGYATYI